MEIVLQLILVSGLLNYSCKATFFNGYRGIVMYAVFSGIIALACYPLIVKTNSDIFNRLISEKSAVLNMAVIISIGMLNNLFETKQKKLTGVLRLVPGVIIAGSVYYMELLLFRTMVGISFVSTALIATALIMLAVFLTAVTIKYFLPDISARYELKFFINIILLALAVIPNAGFAGYNTANYSQGVEYRNLIIIAGIVITGFILGLLLYKTKIKIKSILKK